MTLSPFFVFFPKKATDLDQNCSTLIVKRWILRTNVATLEGSHPQNCLGGKIHSLKDRRNGESSSGDTVDGSEIRRSPVEVGSYIPLFIGFYTSQVVQDS